MKFISFDCRHQLRVERSNRNILDTLISMVDDGVSISLSVTSLVDVDDWNVPTLFGFLLGLPFIYYYRETDNCLGYKDLVLVRTVASWE